MDTNREIVVIGDVHGTFQELCDLLDKIKYNSATMKLIFTGDTMDRGENPIACLRLVRQLCANDGAECVLANHEWRHMKYWQNERRREQTGERNNMRPFNAHDMVFHKQLNEEDINWIAGLPVSIHLRNNWHCVHAGLEPQFDFAHQRPDKVIRCRYVDKNGKALSMGKNYSIPDGGIFWTEEWQGPEQIIFGHSVLSFEEPSLKINKYGIKTIGIDLGCVYGGHLCAYFLDRNEFVSIKAKKNYYPIRDLDDK